MAGIEVTPGNALMDIRSVNTLAEFMGVGKLFFESKMFTDMTSAAQCATKIIAGRELGIGPFASMANLYMIKGKIGMSGNLIASKIKSSGKYNYRVLEKTTEKCLIEFFEHDHSQNTMISIGKESFTMDDARAAGLAGGENWRKWPKNMLFNRCISNGYRTYCPDIFAAGPVYTPDELEPAVKLNEDGEVLEGSFKDTPLLEEAVATTVEVAGVTAVVTGSDLPDAVVAEVRNYDEEPWANPQQSATDARDILYAQAIAEWGYATVDDIRKHVKEHPLWDGRRLQTVDDIIFVASLLKPQPTDGGDEIFGS